MKYLKYLSLFVVVFIGGCTSLSLTITCTAGTSAEITTAIEQPKSVTTSPAIQGNVPIQGGTVTNPVQNQN